jgi:hypothetical protein
MSAENVYGAARVSDGGGFAGLGRPDGDCVPGQLVEHWLAAPVGEPAAEVPDALAVQLDGPRRLGAVAQVPPR